MIKIGIIGCGHWGSNHVRIFNTLENARIKICCDPNRQRLEALRKIYPDLKFSTDYRDSINDKSIDAVVVATPTATHYQIVKTALLSGKHVLCEKPLSIRTRESQDLISLARKKRKIIMVGYVFLYNNGILALKNFIEKNTLGRVFYLHFTRTNLGPIRDDVDVIYDLASHDIAIASFLLKKWPDSASAHAGYFLRRKIADTAFITLHYPANILVNIHVSWLDPKKIRRLTCVGDKKMAIWDDLDTAEPVKVFDKGVIREPFYSDYGEFHLLPREGEVVSPSIRLYEPLKNQNSHFLDCISTNKSSLSNGAFGQNVTRILEAITVSKKNKGYIQKITRSEYK